MFVAPKHTIIQASAGSGKTKVLVDKYLELIKSGEDEKSIICLTYTNAAATEMKERIEKNLNKTLKNPLILTVHSFCLDLITKHFNIIDFAPNTKLLDRDFLKEAFESSMEFVTDDLASKMTKNRCYELIKEFSDKRLLFKKYDNNDFFEFAEIVFNKYDQLKYNFNVLDFHDFINFGNIILEKVELNIKHVLVDEAQDTSEKQWKIIFSLLKKCETSFIVGDIKQSIYSFQGASPKVFEGLISKLENVNIIKMQTSYRSVQEVLNTVNAVFKDMACFENHTSARDSSIKGRVMLMPLTEENTKSIEPKPFEFVKEEVVETSNHAKVLCDLVLSILSSKIILPKTKTFVTPNDIMILVQKRTYIPFGFMKLLKSHEIPYFGPIKLFLLDSLIILDLLSIAKFSVDPNDDYNLVCILKSPFFNFSEDELFEICYNRESTIIDNLKSKNHECLNLLNSFENDHPYNFFRKIFVRFKDIILNYEDQIFIEELLNQAVDFESDIESFIDYLKEKNPVVKAPYGNGLKIMTVHSSKGLQSPIVIIADATKYPDLKKENFLKNNNCVYLKMENEHLKEHAIKLMMEEHERLLYVAMTRAEDFLYITGTKSDSKNANSKNTWYQKIKKALS